MPAPTFRLEKKLIKDGCRLVAGVDEAGRGPLAGPVVAAAIILTSHIKGLNDSKLLSKRKREDLFVKIQQHCLAVGIGIVSNKTIDRINIHQATLRAMKIAVLNLEYYPDYLLIDGKHELDLDFPQQAIVLGDQKSSSIAAASIVAKVTRDRIMKKFHQKHPEYHFHAHKGYGTKLHNDKIRQYGPSPIHRMSFSPLSELFIN